MRYGCLWVTDWARGYGIQIPDASIGLGTLDHRYPRRSIDRHAAGRNHRLYRDRKVFGKPVLDFQNTRFKLAEAKAQATMLRVFVDDCLGKVMRGELTPEIAAMAKLLGSEMQGKLLDEFLQLHGGYGFMSEYKISRAWVDARVARIYGGTSEIMKEIIGRTL
jgi:alkylation response protein AidB-like acyl-CoA dehydrogenase